MNAITSKIERRPVFVAARNEAEAEAVAAAKFAGVARICSALVSIITQLDARSSVAPCPLPVTSTRLASTKESAMGKVYAKHIRAIQSGKVTRSNIIGLRKAFNADLRRAQGRSTSSTCPKVTPDEVTKLYDAVESMRPVVTGELHESGVKLLQSPRYRKRLLPYARIINDIDYFRLIGWTEKDSCYYPIFRAVNSKGEGFNFMNMPWQSGGNGPEVL